MEIVVLSLDSIELVLGFQTWFLTVVQVVTNTGLKADEASRQCVRSIKISPMLLIIHITTFRCILPCRYFGDKLSELRMIVIHDPVYRFNNNACMHTHTHSSRNINKMFLTCFLQLIYIFTCFIIFYNRVIFYIALRKLPPPRSLPDRLSWQIYDILCFALMIKCALNIRIFDVFIVHPQEQVQRDLNEMVASPVLFSSLRACTCYIIISCYAPITPKAGRYTNLFVRTVG
uniref:Uncharacterized protein n=1 Tax=Glossina brevipalpis TaxID=37001 RepID=A0A1A9WSL6_9MUSC